MPFDDRQREVAKRALFDMGAFDHAIAGVIWGASGLHGDVFDGALESSR